MTHQFDFNTSYRQFYIFDKDAEWRTDTPKFWSKVALETGMALERGIIGCGIASYGFVRLTLAFFEQEPLVSTEHNWDRITEGSIKIKSGVFQILPCIGDPDFETSLEKGDYRIRYYGANFDTVMGDDGEDFYRIEVWKAPYQKRKVLKKGNRG